MKKFVSIVLALALALSLCTVAFAAETKTTPKVTKDVSDVGYDLYEVNDTDKLSPAPAIEAYTEQQTRTVTTDKGKVTTTVIPAYYTDEDDNYWFVTTADFASARLFDGKKFVCYVVYVPGSVELEFLDVADKAISEGDDCGDYEADGYLFGTDAYEEGNEPAAFDGKLIFVDTGDTIETVPHTWAYKNITFKGVSGAKNENSVPVAIKCSECGKTFKVVKDTAIPESYIGALDKNAIENCNNNRTDGLYPLIVNADDYVVLLDAEDSSAGTTSTTVDSSKTFDAGVAMYVGLSLMSVAGSAVVIGKKKEF